MEIARHINDVLVGTLPPKTASQYDASSSPDLTILYGLLWIALLAFHLFLCHRIAIEAQRKGRNYGAFFFISFFFSEIIAFIIVASVAPIQDTSFVHQTQQARVPQQVLRATCPYCAEEVLPAAVLCKHCKSSMTPIVIEEPVWETEVSSTTVTESEQNVDVDKWQRQWDFHANFVLANKKIRGEANFEAWSSAGSPPIKPWLDAGKPDFLQWLEKQPKDYWGDLGQAS